MSSIQPTLNKKKKDRKFYIQLQKLGVIIGAWVLISVMITCLDHLSLYSQFSAGHTANYSFVKNLIFNLSAALMGSIMGGVFLVFYINERQKDAPYGKTLLSVSFTFITIVAIITIVLGILLVRNETGAWPFVNDSSTAQFKQFVRNPLHLKNLLIWGAVTALTQFALQVNDKFGQGLLWDFIKGKYNQPKNEQRIFMMLDIKSSTTIAEKLGNVDYYKFLKDFFSDITESIIYNGGKIYQYAGDEVIISWKYEEDKATTQCLNCYFDIRQHMNALNPKYQKRYGLAPDFKAALHFGDVTAGEIGIIKRDLTYSGDVLNTTARILSQCNPYNQKLLVSGELHQYLIRADDSFIFTKMGEEILRGKAGSIEIWAVGL